MKRRLWKDRIPKYAGNIMDRSLKATRKNYGKDKVGGLLVPRIRKRDLKPQRPKS